MTIKMDLSDAIGKMKSLLWLVKEYRPGGTARVNYTDIIALETIIPVLEVTRWRKLREDQPLDRMWCEIYDGSNYMYGKWLPEWQHFSCWYDKKQEIWWRPRTGPDFQKGVLTSEDKIHLRQRAEKLIREHKTEDGVNT